MACRSLSLERAMGVTSTRAGTARSGGTSETGRAVGSGVDQDRFDASARRQLREIDAVATLGFDLKPQALAQYLVAG